jgi:hypothetical protein
VQLDSIDSKSVCRELDKLKYYPVNNDPEMKSSVASNDYGLLDRHEFAPLKSEIEKYFNYFAKDTFLYDCKFKIVNSWATKTVTGIGSGNWHRHSNCLFTAIYYPRGKEDYAPLILDLDRKRDYSIEPIDLNQYNNNKYFVTPGENELIIFPSNIPHTIGRHLSDEIRYSIAMNYMPIGKIGSYDSCVNIDAK